MSSSQPEPSDTMPSEQTLHVGFVLFEPRFGAFVWTLGENCLRTEALRRGIRFSTVPVRTADEQADAIARLVDDRIDAIIMKPMSVSHAGISAALKKAHAVGIPVVTLDSPLPNDPVLCTVGSNNAQGQSLVAEQVFARLGGRGCVAYFHGDERVPSGVLRSQSFRDTLRRHPQITLGYEAMLDWVAPVTRRSQGAAFMREALARCPDLDAVISSTDEGALGAMDVIAEAGLSARILIAGFDGIPEALIAIHDGRMAATARQLPRSIAARALDVVQAALAGEAVPPRLPVEVELIQPGNVERSALDSLQMIPGLIHHLAENHETQRRLQLAVIDAQRNVLATLVAVSSALASIRDLHELKRRVLELLRERFALHSAHLYTAPHEGDGDGDGDMTSPLILRAASPVSADTEPPGEAAVACATSGEMHVGAHGELAEVVLPLLSGTRVLGVLQLRSAWSKAFDSEACAVLQAIAYQVAIALDNAYLYRETVEQARLQEENRERLLIAEKMASLGRLTAGIAHEMNTPLAAVRSAIAELDKLVEEYREAIGDDSVNEDDHREIAADMTGALKLAGSAAERAASFVRGVKSQTRDLSAQQAIVFNAVATTKEAVLLLSHALRQGKCTVRITHDADVMDLHGSPSRLAQVVTNLVTNAIDACADKDGGDIEIMLAQQAGSIEMRVRDSGSGIAPDILPRVFDPMFSTKPFGSGTGLGLTIVHDIVCGDFGGSVAIDSTVGAGTCFILQLKSLAPVARSA